MGIQKSPEMARTTFSPNRVPVYRPWQGKEAAGAWFWLWRRSRTKTASDVPLKVPLSATMRTLTGFTELKRAAHCAGRLHCLMFNVQEAQRYSTGSRAGKTGKFQ